MKYSYQIPHDSVAEYVQHILLIEDYQITNPFTLPLYANGFPSLLFLNSQATIKNNVTSYLTLFGQTILPQMLTINESFTLIAYFFKPYSLVSLFGIEANELTDKPVDFSLIKPSAAKHMQEQLLNANTVEDMMRYLNNFICKVIDNKKNNSIIQYATNQIIKNADKVSLPALQKDLHVTERTLQRLFEKNIGVSAKLFRRIIQFNSAFQQLNKKQFIKLTDIAYENGFSDQSHFIRVFKEFTNITPSDYLNARFSLG